MEYIKRVASDNKCKIIEVSPNGFERVISEEQPDFKAWLSDGNKLLTEPDTTPIIKPPTLAQLKESKKDQIASNRYDAEVGGVEFGGYRMHTDRESQSKYTGAIVAYQAVGKHPAAWKTVDGWMPIETAETLLELATAVQEHINACYAKEAALEQAIHSATTVKEVEAIKW